MILAALLLLGLFLPTQLGLHFWPSWAHVFGLSIDYLSPTLYLTDILLIILFLLTLKRFTKTAIRHQQLALTLLLIALLNLLTSLIPLNTAITWLHLLLLLNFSLAISRLKKLSLRLFIFTLTISTLAISLIAIAQFFKQSSLDGVFYFLGERHFNLTTPGIAKFSLCPLITDNCRLFLRPYSVFSHPNSLAGFLLVFSFLIFALPKPIRPRHHRLLALVSIFTLLLTYSRAAIFTLLFLFFINLTSLRKSSSFILAIILFVFFFTLTTFSFLPRSSLSDPSISQRISLNQSALGIISSHPFTGTGLNNFIPALANTSPQQSKIILQPVHNIHLLLTSELGLGLLFAIIAAIYLFQPPVSITPIFILPFLAILLTGTFDHYWLTLVQNRLLFFLLIGLGLNKTLTQPR